MKKAIGLFSAMLCLAGFALAAPQAQKHVAFDFDGDGRSDLTVFRPADGRWHISRSQEGGYQTTFGVATDTIVPADYDGDGKTDIAVYRNGTPGAFYVLNSTTGAMSAVGWGVENDIPVASYDTH